ISRDSAPQLSARFKRSSAPENRPTKALFQQPRMTGFLERFAPLYRALSYFSGAVVFESRFWKSGAAAPHSKTQAH
ncbi:hypothetical protein, partial [Chthoniobacter flavus]|uniref:hypothetical protein n=1 Tax=Chthoniobacter flavus TaxID=191863 RepID=UPI001A9D8652